MKTYLTRLLAGTILAGAISAPAFADSFNVDVDATVATALSINQTAGISFGLFSPGTVDSGFEMFPSGGGTVSPTAGADFTSLTGGELGSITISGTPGAAVLIYTDGSNVLSGDGNLQWSGGSAKCETAGNPGDNACAGGITDALDGSGNLVLTMGGRIDWIGPHPVAPGQRTLIVPINIAYE